MTFKRPDLKQSFPDLEKQIAQFWKDNEIFQKSLDTRKSGEEFNFYDGPPFATGTPHYGHILAGTLKDVIPRYQTMLGKYVPRNFGWDCHGLPIENLVEKKLGLSGKDDIENNIGVYEFNEACRANVFQYTDEWRQVVERMGRWVDMDNDYKTMDTSFMESVWWVFKTIYDKGLIYQGNRIVPYCPRCTTPLSNFEVNQGYKDKQDRSLTVKFKVKGNESKYILAWTTTPWTLYANLGLAVGKDIMYSEILDKKSGETYVLATEKLGDYYSSDQDYTLVREYKGSCLEGIEYEPLFPDFDLQLRELEKDLGTGVYLGKNAYHVVLGHHVSTESGTGIVHIAPAYGEDDFEIGKSQDLGFVIHINDSGKTYNLLDHNDMPVFEFNDYVIDVLREQKTHLFKISTIDHSYPHCWRCDTPLIYRAISAWYVAVERIRDQMVKNNQSINWVPENIKDGRFGKWLEGARDWNISRNRYWGSALPVWQSEDKSEEVCIGSIEEMYELNKDFGQIEKLEDGDFIYTKTGKPVDIHKHFVDDILLKHPKSGNTLKRIPEVLDCWFESGSMPYASVHYPFKNKDNFHFPAEFIAEGLDQTRGWFYTLLILGTALFDKAPFENVIVNGIILAEDGKKMAKSLKNYTDPNLLMDRFGADAMRFYLMNSPVVEAQDLRFSDTGVEEVVKKVILPLWNTYSFFTTYANIDSFTPQEGGIYYVRHGETDNNKYHIVNGGDDDLDLNETGINQAIDIGKRIAMSSTRFDVIVTSPMARTKHTTKLIVEQLGYDVEVVEDESLREQSYGEFRGMSHDEIREKYNCKNNRELTRVYRNNKEEPLKNFEARVIDGYMGIEERYKGKNVLLVSHGGVFRPINKYLNNLDDEIAYYGVPGPYNATLYKLPSQRHNNLDKWIISELHSLIGEVRNGFDTYTIAKSTKSIVSFMDSLTNWYVRRSRKRFWDAGMSQDKQEAYHTLYDVLCEFTKILAPIMPFISEYIFKELTGKESVHLELFPEANRSLVLKDLITQTDSIREIISLGLALRSDKNIRVRQPLPYVKITTKLPQYFEDIVKEELNVKEVIVFDDKEMPTQICKPNPKILGPRFGSKLKDILQQAKSGDFTRLEDDRVKVGDEVLEVGEFELEFISNNNINGDTEVLLSGGGSVVALGIEITQELKNEGIMRDVVRYIQDLRKEAGYEVDDRIIVSLSGLSDDILDVYAGYIQDETLSTLSSDINKANIEKIIELEGFKIRIQLKK